ncbi:hypothetical protein EV361DRAFT_880735 [Lentinula raphanica]|nr:hypothetical protein EV361DRAFT_880735 [Lentinula raphanica]
MQAWFYYRKYSKRDNWAIQALVAAVIICDTCQIGFLYGGEIPPEINLMLNDLYSCRIQLHRHEPRKPSGIGED